MLRKALAFVVPLVGCLAAAPALAQDSMAACNAAYVDAQLTQKDGKYLAAAQKAQVCSQPACGEALSSECAKLYDSIQTATPSVVFGAKDGDQNDLFDVTVSVDGKVVKERLDGTPVALDAGVHVVRFEAKGVPPVEKTYAVRSGEKLRLITETLGEKRVVAPAQPLPPASVPPTPSMSSRSARIAAIVAGILGVGGFATFGALYAVGTNDYNALKSKCGASPHCAESLVDGDPSHGMFAGGYVGLGVGIAGLATAGTLTMVSLGRRDGTVVRVAPTTTGATATLQMTF